MKKDRQDRYRHDADRQIDPEHERPMQVLHDEGAEYGSDQRRQPPDARQPALQPRPLGRRIDVADDGGGDRLDGAGAQSLQGAKRDQRHHAGGEAAGGRAEQEYARSDKDHAPAAEQVRQPPVDRGGHRLRQKVGGEHPAEQTEAAELRHDGRHGGGHDGALHGRHEDGHHTARRDQPPAEQIFDRNGWARYGWVGQGRTFGYSDYGLPPI